MGIKFNCHACGGKLNVKSFLAGKRGICPHCGAKLHIPRQSTRGKDAVAEEAVGASVATAATGAGSSVASYSATTAHPSQPATSANTGWGGAMESPATAYPAAPTYQPPSPVPSDPVAEAPNAVWYVRPPSGGQFGPAPADTMRRWIREGRVTPESLVWREGWADWKQADSVIPEMASKSTSAPTAGPAAATASPAPAPAPSASPTPASSASTPRPAPSSNNLALIIIVLLVLLIIPLAGLLAWIVLGGN